MRCPGCGADVPAGTTDCPFCGRHLASSVTGDWNTNGSPQPGEGYGAGYPGASPFGTFGGYGASPTPTAFPGAEPSAGATPGAGMNTPREAAPSMPLYGAGTPQAQPGGWPGYPQQQQQYPAGYAPANPGANPGYPPQGMGQPAPASQGFPPQGYAQGYPPQGYPQGYGQAHPGYPQGYPPQGYPQAYPPQGMGQAASPSQAFTPEMGQPGQVSQALPPMGQHAQASQALPQMGQAAPSSQQAYPGYPGYPPMGGMSGGMPGGMSDGGPGGMYGSPVAPQKKKGSRGLIVGLVAAGVALVVVLALGAVGVMLLRGSAPTTNGTSGTSTSSNAPGASAATATTTAEVLFQDALASNTNNWQGTGCAFKTDGFHITGVNGCEIPADLPNNVDIKVTGKAIKVQQDASDGYGIGLRGSSTGAAYYFLVSPTGDWSFLNCTTSNCTPIVDNTHNTAIKTEPGVANTIEVRANGNTFDFYANGTHLGSTTNSTYTSGTYALLGGTQDSDDVTFSNLIVTAVGK